MVSVEGLHGTNDKIYEVRDIIQKGVSNGEDMEKYKQCLIWIEKVGFEACKQRNSRKFHR